MRCIEIDGTDHEDDEEEPQRDHHRKLRIEEELQRLIRQMQPHEHLIDDTLATEHGEPGDGPGQIAGPEGNDEEEQQRDFQYGLLMTRHSAYDTGYDRTMTPSRRSATTWSVQAVIGQNDDPGLSNDS